MGNGRNFNLCASVPLLVALALTAAPAFAQPVVVAEFDCAAGHAFAGFGLQVWPLKGRQEPLLRVVDDFRAKFVRWKILPDLEKADPPDGVPFDGLVNWIERFSLAQDDVSGEGGFRFFRRLQSLGINHLAASWAVPVKWRTAGSVQDNGVRPIQDNRVDDYGRLLAAEVAVLERHGTHPYAIELLNEPVTKMTPDQYTRLVGSFRAWRSRSGLPAIPIAGPGTVFTWENGRYLQAVAAAGSKLDIVSTHAYDALKTRQLASLAPLIASLPSGWDRPIFVTEYGIDQELWYHNSDAIDGIPYGVLAAAQTLALLGSGANAVFYWQAQDPPWSRRQWGLLSKEDRRRPAVDALRTILRPLEIGDKIISSGPHDEALPVALFARTAQLVLEIANPNPQGQDYSISLRNCRAAPLSISHSDAWPASRTVEARPIAPNGLRVTLPGDTVVSITMARPP